MPAKGSVSILVTLQLIVAIILFLENSLNLTKNAEHFESDETNTLNDIGGDLLQLVAPNSTHLSHHSLENLCIPPQRCSYLQAL
ncbi:hypothetical protein Y032_0130g1545 [Ancylostoma ceylanicum]|nr:hypothetical protein Y032_0130g1545 [Ancylostoma ceylanicum]